MNEQVSKNGGKMLTRVTWRKLSEPHWRPQIPQGLKWNWTRASAMRRRRQNCLIRDTVLCVLLTIKGILKSKLQNFGVGMYNFYSPSSLYIFKYSPLLLLFICLFISFLFIGR